MMDPARLHSGYTQFRNSLLTALCHFHCSGAQKDILLAIVRLTDGFHRQSCEIGISDLAKMTGRNRRKVGSDVAVLIRCNVVLVESGHSCSKSRTLMINTDVGQWVCPKKGSVSGIDDTSMPQIAHSGMTENEHNSIKRNHTKRKIVSSDAEIESQAVAIYESYATQVRPGARADAIRNITKRLREGIDAATLKASIDHYVARGLAEDVQFRIQCNNFFGRAERFKEFLEPPKSQQRQFVDTVENDPKYQAMIREGVSDESE